MDVIIPAVGESINEVTIAQWMKSNGDQVEKDEVLCELESDKATFELNAEEDGVLSILVEEGETVAIGTHICTIKPGSNGASASSNSPAKAEQATEDSPNETQSEQIIEITVPPVGESITEVTLGNWEVGDGEQVEPDQVVCEIESDKATFEVTAEHAGTLKHVVQEGATLEIGALICTITTGASGNTSTSASQSGTSNTADYGNAAPTNTGMGSDDSSDNYAKGHASPAAAKILAEKGLDASTIKGTGVNGRITKEDAEKAQKQPTAPIAASAKSETSAQSSSPAPQAGERTERRERLSSMRKTISKRLVSVKNETAMLTTFNEVDMTGIMDIRKKYKDQFKEKYEVGLGFMSFFTKACTIALQEWPSVNAQIDGDQMVFADYCDVSIAVSSPKGLVVPVIRNAEKMNFMEIESEVIRLAKKARDGKLSIPEMTGGTFTITNGGIFGSMLSTPIINAPQSAILGMHNIVQRPMAIDGEVKIRPIMYVALSYDHRIIDGRESVSFLYRVKELLEDPTRMMLAV